MSKLRKHFITVLAVLFCALLALSTALIIPKNKIANANSAMSSALEIYDTATGRFKADALQTLYSNINGVTTYENLSNSFADTQGTVLKTYMAMPVKTTVKLGGYDWNVVAVSRSQLNEGQVKGDLVATLWLSTGSSLTSSFAAEGFTTNGIVTIGTDKYAPNEYGMSLIRSTLVGGNYATSAGLAAGTQNQVWAAFLDNYGNFIDTPEQVCGASGYQAKEMPDTSNIGQAYLFPNDAYKEITDADIAGYDNTWYSSAIKDIQGCTGYDNWKNDKLWLPSICETGFSAGRDVGIWGINNDDIRKTAANAWTRSGDSTAANKGFYLTSTGSGFGATTVSQAVRPAFHLNLSAADEDSRKVFFDEAGSTGNDGNGYVHVYNGQTFEKEIRDYGRIDKQSNTSGSGYVSSTGKFSATKPDESADKTYALVVKPKDGYFWKDWETRDDLSGSGDNDDKKYGERTYKITIQLAEIDVNWGNLTVTSGGSLLQDSSPSVYGGTSVEESIKEYYCVVPPGDDLSLPSDPTWTLRSEDNESDFTASQSGTYRVWYKIEADYHNPTEVASYDVTVSTDSVKITVDGDLSTESATYSEGRALIDTETNQAWLKNQFRSKVKVTYTSSGTVYNGTDSALDSLFGNLDIYLFTYNNNNSKVNSTTNDNGYYDAGTYLLGVRYKDTVPAANRTLTFTWETASGREIHPTFTIAKKEIDVKVIAAAADGSLTHVYGELHVEMTYALVNESDLSDNEDIDDLKLWDNFTRKDNGEELSKRTPAGTYYIVGAALESNYVVKFADSEYVITKRSVKLQVADETVGYGTSFDGYTYKAMTAVENNVVTGDDIQVLTAGVPRSLKQGAVDYDFSNTLYIGDYDLYAGVETDGKYIYETDNYIFEILPGKLKITKGNFDLSGVRLDNKGYVYDGEPKPAQLNGELPGGVTVSYRYVNYETAEELDGAPTEVGLYLVYASFTHNSQNHNPITTVKAAYIRIAYTEEEANAEFPAIPTDEELAAAADLAKKKADAKEELEKEAQAKKDEIDADLNRTPEEKAAAKSEVDKELADGKYEIDKAKDKDGVDSALSDGKKEIDDTADLAKKKGAAKSELDKAAQAKKDAIDADPDLTDEEKAAAKAEVDKELEEGKKAIDNATDISGVQSAESSTKTNIENIKPEHKGSFPWWILAVIAGVLVATIVVIIVVVKRRNSEDDDGGYDDFYDDEYDYDEEEEVDDDGDEAFGY